MSLICFIFTKITSALIVLRYIVDHVLLFCVSYMSLFCFIFTKSTPALVVLHCFVESRYETLFESLDEVTVYCIQHKHGNLVRQ